MPTNVTGNPTGVAAPAVLPGPDTLVVTAQPIAGEGDTAASVNQAFSALGNEQAWEKVPTGAAPASPGTLDAAYKQPIKAYHNVRGQRRAFVDHRGRLGLDRSTKWQEDWNDKAFALLTGTQAADTAWAKRWLATQSLGGGSPAAKILTYQRGAGYPSGPAVYTDGSLILDSGNITAGPPGVQLVESAGGTQFSDDGDIVFQTDFIQGDGGTPGSGNVETSYGLADGLSGATGLLASTTPYAASIAWIPGHANWQLYLFNPNVGGSPVLTDLGAASLTMTRVRIEVQGANVSDDSQRRVQVYGDGAILANVAYDMTVPSAPPFLAPFFRLYSAGSFVSRWGVTDYQAVRYAGDIAY